MFGRAKGNIVILRGTIPWICGAVPLLQHSEKGSFSQNRRGITDENI